MARSDFFYRWNRNVRTFWHAFLLKLRYGDKPWVVRDNQRAATRITAWRTRLISYVSGRTLATSEFSYRKGIAGGLFIMFVGSALLVISQGLLPLLTGMTLLSLGFGIFLPAASSAIASVVSAEDRGGIFSYYSMIRFLGVALGPTVFGSWMINVEQMMFNSFFIMSLSLLSILFSWSCIPIIQACSPPFET